MIAVRADMEINGATVALRGLTLADLYALGYADPDGCEAAYAAFAHDGALEPLILDHADLAARALATAMDLPGEAEAIAETYDPADIYGALKAVADLTFRRERPAPVEPQRAAAGRKSETPADFAAYRWSLTELALIATAHGHRDPESYPLGTLADVAESIQRHENQRLAAQAIAFQAALATVPNMGVKPATTKKAFGAFRSLIKSLTGAPAHG